MIKTLWNVLAAQLSELENQTIQIHHHTAIGGGSINQTYQLHTNRGCYFLKLSNTDNIAMFQAEAEGLQALHNSNSLLVPLPYCWGSHAPYSYLIMQYLDLHHSQAPAQQTALAAGLASMHQVQHDKFGWYRDNTIGATPQYNTQNHSWISFWQEMRMQPQLRWVHDKGYTHLTPLGEQLLPKIPQLFTQYTPYPSLLHGDLWSGNYAFTSTGEAIIFDPAVYYGDRESDIAMTELFGGFSPVFYQHYHTLLPLDDGYPLRKKLYQLYHILNHVNLFGGGYTMQANNLLQELLQFI